MTVSVGDVIRVTAKMSYGVGGGALQNTMHWQHNTSGPISDALAVTAMGLLLEQLYGHIQLQTASIVQYLTYDVFNVTQSLITGFAAWPTFTVGLGTGPATSPQVSGLIVAQTSKSRTQGRVYISGQTEDGVTDGAWEAPTLANMALFAGELLVTQVHAGAKFDYIVYNRLLATFVAPVGALVKGVTRTQRRRSIGFGA